MTWLQALFSGIIQGLTEFLPVSSSGHLVIFNALFGEGGRRPGVHGVPAPGRAGAEKK